MARFIIVDRGATDGMRYLGRDGWAPTVRKSEPFDSFDAADTRLRWIVPSEIRERCVVRRVVPAGTRRARAAEATIATLRVQLAAYEQTDEAMSLHVAALIAERDALAERVAELRRFLSPECAA